MKTCPICGSGNVRVVEKKATGGDLGRWIELHCSNVVCLRRSSTYEPGVPVFTGPILSAEPELAPEPDQLAPPPTPAAASSPVGPAPQAAAKPAEESNSHAPTMVVGKPDGSFMFTRQAPLAGGDWKILFDGRQDQNLFRATTQLVADAASGKKTLQSSIISSGEAHPTPCELQVMFQTHIPGVPINSLWEYGASDKMHRVRAVIGDYPNASVSLVEVRANRPHSLELTKAVALPRIYSIRSLLTMDRIE